MPTNPNVGPAPPGPAALLAGRRADTLSQIADLNAQVDDIVAAAESSNLDDEHDPEGATIGFERAQLTSLLAAARERLREIEAAEQRLRSGTYGGCARCGEPIPADRLVALPTARHCLGCAAR